MQRCVGTITRGLRCPIIRQGDNITEIVVDSVLLAAKNEGFELRNKDIIGITESIVARAQGNYASIDAIATDVRAQLGGETIGVIFPILSRNRFSTALKGIARSAKKIVLMLSYPSDEVGNRLLTFDQIDEALINPYQDTLTLAKYRELFGDNRHEFTGVDYVDFYKELIEAEGCEVEIIFNNHPQTILNYTKNVLTCDIHTYKRTKRILKAHQAERVIGLADVLTKSVNGSGFNTRFGLLGSNKSDEDTVKLFPHDCQDFVENVQAKLLEVTGKTIEVMVYGDGAFKDPQGHIWELADPVVSPAFTSGLSGVPNEVKLKYLADNDFKDLTGDALQDAIKKRITSKDTDLIGDMMSLGTTPRQLTDLIGSLCDLTSGSGDKGTPIVYIQGYFDNYTE
jgi:F420-0:gamma-glutamyl ligase